MASGGVRLARGWAGAASATFVSAVFHLLAGGGTPEFSVLLLALALSGLVCTLLAGRILSLWRMGTAVALSQAIFHWLFSAEAALANTPVLLPEGAAQGAHAGHDMGSMALMDMSGATGAAAMPAHAEGSAMWLGHALATMATVALLRHGEVSAVRLLRALRMRLVRFMPLFRPVALAGGARKLPASWPVLALPSLGVPLLAMRHRGPPALLPMS